VQPEVSDAALELYEALDPAFTTGDEDRGWPTLLLCAALVSGDIDAIHELVTDSEDGLGWEILFDPTNVPARYLPWLAQPAGAVLRPDMDEAQQRAAIMEPEGFGRGTLAAIESVAKRRLTGTKAVVITERYTGSAWRLLIETLEDETPDPDLTEAEIIAEQKPIGILLFFNSRAAWSWEELVAEEATWLDVREDFGTWFDVRVFEP
jgi:Phage tail protein (Tail_P2_I)